MGWNLLRSAGMGRPLRAAVGGYVYHVLNRANARMTIFGDDEDYEAFERVLAEAVERTETRLLAYCLMPNHWHLVVWPRKDGELSRFVGWLTLTHTQRWHAHRQFDRVGPRVPGPLQVVPRRDGRAFLHGRAVCGAECRAGEAGAAGRGVAMGKPVSLAAGFGRRPAAAVGLAAGPPAGLGGTCQSAVDRGGVRRDPTARVQRGSPFGDSAWSDRTVRRLGLETTLRPRGRPKKQEKGS